MRGNEGMAPKKEVGSHEVDSLTLLLTQKEDEMGLLHQRAFKMETKCGKLDAALLELSTSSRETDEKLKDIMACLSSEVKAEHEKGRDLELALQELTAERGMTVEMLNRDIAEIRNTHKFVTEDLHLQLANAQVQLRDIDDYRDKKTAIEQEVARLKEQMEKEKKENQNAISDVERAIIQEKEKLKKEMALCIEETKRQMLECMDDQLYTKTKRTILENEQLAKELSYHMRQSELLLQKNDKLVQENENLQRQVILEKEIVEDLARRNTMNQKTIQILFDKFQEKIYVASEKKSEEEELTSHLEKLRVDLQGERQEIVRLKECIQESASCCESFVREEEAMKFLHACLDDLEMERKGKKSNNKHLGVVSDADTRTPENLTSLELLPYEQRQEFLMHLLQTAISLRQGDVQNADLLQDSPNNDFSSSVADLWFPKNLSIEGLKVDEDSQKGTKPVSVGSQTEAMELEKRSTAEMGRCLRACMLQIKS